MSALTDILAALPLAATLTFYFYFKPDIGFEVSILFVGVWLLCFILDAKITITNAKLMHYEKNLIFPLLYCKFGSKLSPIIQCMLEFIVMVFVVFLFEGQILVAPLSVVALVFGLAHLHAYVSNVMTVNKIKKS